MLNSEVIFLEFVTGTNDFGGEKKKKHDPIFLKFMVGRGGQHNKFFFWPCHVRLPLSLDSRYNVCHKIWKNLKN